MNKVSLIFTTLKNITCPNYGLSTDIRFEFSNFFTLSFNTAHACITYANYCQLEIYKHKLAVKSSAQKEIISLKTMNKATEEFG